MNKDKIKQKAKDVFETVLFCLIVIISYEIGKLIF